MEEREWVKESTLVISGLGVKALIFSPQLVPWHHICSKTEEETHNTVIQTRGCVCV